MDALRDMFCGKTAEDATVDWPTEWSTMLDPMLLCADSPRHWRKRDDEAPLSVVALDDDDDDDNGDENDLTRGLFLMRGEAHDDEGRGSPPKRAQARSMIRNVLTQNFLFSTVISKDLEELIEKMSTQTVPRHGRLVAQGSAVPSFAIVASGKLSVFQDGQKVASYWRGDAFGEDALLGRTVARTTVIAASRAKVWLLSRRDARQVLAQNASRRNTEIATLLRRVPIFRALDSERLTKIAGIVHVSSFAAGETVCRRGDPGTSLYVIQAGSVSIDAATEGPRKRSPRRSLWRMSHRRDKPPVTLGSGDYFGERSLFTGEPRNATVAAWSALTLLIVERDRYEPRLGLLRRLLDESLVLRALHSTGLFANLTSEQCAHVASSFQERAYAQGDTIVTEGQRAASALFIIKAGSCAVWKRQHDNDQRFGRRKSALAVLTSRLEQVATLTAGNFFGELALISDEERSATVTATEPTVCCVIDRSALLETLQCDQKSLVVAFAATAQRRARGVGHLKPSDLKVVSLLGVSPSASVKLVTCRERSFALKMIHKSQVVKQKQQKHVLNERRILAMVAHPNIVEFFASLKDYHCLYLVLEFVPGGELHGLLHPKRGQRLGLFVEEAVFYSACVILALDHLHDFAIAYRDLKPENLLVDAKGYIKLVDFGLAAVVKGLAYTFCGTPEYLAPEMITGDGHTKAVDLWALGCLIFEMLAGRTPFVITTKDSHTAVCNRIVNRKFDAPDEFDEDAVRVIDKLLDSDPRRRLVGAKDVRSDAWYAALDFEDLYSGRVAAPWVPKLDGPLDTSHYDTRGLTDLAIDRSYRHAGDWDDAF